VESGLRRLLRNLIDAGAVVAALVFIGSYFPRAVMFTATTTNGGDMGSHVYPAVFLREVLLPHGQMTGWCPGNYCGFPLFQFYFPLPFVLMAAMSLVIPLMVGFKLASVLGTFLLPPCSYLSLRLMRVPFPGPALGALATLCFLFMEANSMWGANIPSTLAGEFAFSLGVALAILFIGSLRRAIDTRRGYAWNALLVMLIGLAHGYTLLWAGVTSLTELIATRGWWRRVGGLIAIHGLAILLLAFWLLPLLAYAKWTTAYSHVWFIQSWREIMPPILWPVTGVAVATALLVGVVSIVGREPFPRGLATLWSGTIMGVLFYFAARALHVVDIRFFPFSQVGLCLTAGAGLGYLLARLPAPEIWPAVGALAIFPFVQSHVTFIPSWITWNYSGFERKGPWPAFHEVNEYLHGTYRDPRVVFEHNPDYESIGTIRAFENLPLFSGRSTTEGLYMQASPTAPFVFYAQSEYSKVNSCPFPDWGCSRLNLDRGVEHLRMLNVSQLIARSDTVKAAAAEHPGFEREKRIGPYDIFRVKQNDGRYAIPLDVAPVLVVTSKWKEDAYRWWKQARPEDPVPVFVESADAEGRAVFPTVVDALPREIPRKPYTGPPPPLKEELETDRITVTGCHPGRPVLVRISYHPRWQSLTGERVWLAGPSFMLVVPRGERFELVYGSAAPVVLGHALTWVGCALFLLAVLPVGQPLRRVGTRLVHLPPVPALARLFTDWAPATRRAVLAAGLVGAVGFYTVIAIAARTSDADSTYRRGQVIYDAGRLADSLPYFRHAQQLAPLSNTAIHSTYYESIVLYRLEKWSEAEKVFQRLVDTFPEANAAPEALYHVGLCRARRGEIQPAVDAWHETQKRFADTQWAKYAGERLAEVEQRTGKAGG
jgi:6-pyruvoyl-tetrahydropterin synthase related domain